MELFVFFSVFHYGIYYEEWDKPKDEEYYGV